MMRSLYSGVSGIKVHQTKMDVIGNNISNVNTVGFKASTVAFSDVLYQTSSAASGPADSGKTGINAKQIGLGAGLSSITSQISLSGGSQRTDNPFDIMIEGDGFFVVNNGSGNCFTKAGNFSVDAAGTLCTPGGYAVMGWQVDPNNPSKCVADTVSPLQIMSPQNLYAEPEATTEVYLKGNIDSKDTQIASETGKTVSVSFYDALGQSYMMTLRITQTEESTTSYSVVPTNIFDESGKSIFVRENVDEDTQETTYEAAGITTFQLGGITYTAEVDAETGMVTFGDDAITLNFSGATGDFMGIGDGTDATGESIAFQVESDPNPFAEINIDFSKLTMYANSGTSNIESVKGDFEGHNGGKQAGDMSGVSIDNTGRIYGVYDNGDTKLLGQIVVATFENATGLEAIGNNMYVTTMNSGDFDGIGEDVSVSGGTFTTGVLEMSNVDLAQQFTDMITTQRGFQANSRIITTTDTLLEELINLKR